MKPTIGIIGGSGLYSIPGFERHEERTIDTPWGAPSDAYIVGHLAGREVAFLARHGRGHRLSPLGRYFRANIWGMKSRGVERILSRSAVGSLKEEHRPQDFVLRIGGVKRVSEAARHQQENVAPARLTQKLGIGGVRPHRSIPWVGADEERTRSAYVVPGGHVDDRPSTAAPRVRAREGQDAETFDRLDYRPHPQRFAARDSSLVPADFERHHDFVVAGLDRNHEGAWERRHFASVERHRGAAGARWHLHAAVRVAGLDVRAQLVFPGVERRSGEIVPGGRAPGAAGRPHLDQADVASWQHLGVW